MKAQKKCFTLVELLVVMMIVGLLAIVVYNMNSKSLNSPVTNEFGQTTVEISASDIGDWIRNNTDKKIISNTPVSVMEGYTTSFIIVYETNKAPLEAEKP